MKNKPFKRKTTIGFKIGDTIRIKSKDIEVKTVITYIFDLFFIGTPLGSFRIDFVEPI